MTLTPSALTVLDERDTSDRVGISADQQIPGGSAHIYDHSISACLKSGSLSRGCFPWWVFGSRRD